MWWKASESSDVSEDECWEGREKQPEEALKHHSQPLPRRASPQPLGSRPLPSSPAPASLLVLPSPSSPGAQAPLFGGRVQGAPHPASPSAPMGDPLPGPIRAALAVRGSRCLSPSHRYKPIIDVNWGARQTALQTEGKRGADVSFSREKVLGYEIVSPGAFIFWKITCANSF